MDSIEPSYIMSMFCPTIKANRGKRPAKVEKALQTSGRSSQPIRLYHTAETKSSIRHAMYAFENQKRKGHVNLDCFNRDRKKQLPHIHRIQRNAPSTNEGSSYKFIR